MLSLAVALRCLRLAGALCGVLLRLAGRLRLRAVSAVSAIALRRSLRLSGGMGLLEGLRLLGLGCRILLRRITERLDRLLRGLEVCGLLEVRGLLDARRRCEPGGRCEAGGGLRGGLGLRRLKLRRPWRVLLGETRRRRAGARRVGFGLLRVLTRIAHN
ncbi:hypothetical protein B4915_04810 [Leucobacter massiliensis]|uniref:Uncharacterized protein n=1 Tax=Leucobacter massiliensis TaxID=1686285 RepID=A0A2S9QQA7_9MICO|nr:hypothetical protein B4915_04810 [Leucobacter massiliensis]